MPSHLLSPFISFSPGTSLQSLRFFCTTASSPAALHAAFWAGFLGVTRIRETVQDNATRPQHKEKVQDFYGPLEHFGTFWDMVTTLNGLKMLGRKNYLYIVLNCDVQYCSMVFQQPLTTTFRRLWTNRSFLIGICVKTSNSKSYDLWFMPIHVGN